MAEEIDADDGFGVVDDAFPDLADDLGLGEPLGFQVLFARVQVTIAGFEVSGEEDIHFLAEESGAGVESSEFLPGAGAVAGFFDEFAFGGLERSLPGVDFAGGEFPDDVAGGEAVLADEEDAAFFVEGDDAGCSGGFDQEAVDLLAVAVDDVIVGDLEERGIEQEFAPDELLHVAFSMVTLANVPALLVILDASPVMAVGVLEGEKYLAAMRSIGKLPVLFADWRWNASVNPSDEAGATLGNGIGIVPRDRTRGVKRRIPEIGRVIRDKSEKGRQRRVAGQAKRFATRIGERSTRRGDWPGADGDQTATGGDDPAVGTGDPPGSAAGDGQRLACGR